MDPKNLSLIALGVLLVLYISFEVIRERIYLGKSSCDGSCVRFCAKTVSEAIDFRLPAFEHLSQTFSSIKNNYCYEGADLEDDETWSFLKNGIVNVKGPDSRELEWPYYCLYTNETETILFTCFTENAASNIEHNYPYFMLLSVPFLLITIFIYAWIPELRNLPGKCLMSYAASIMLLYLVYAFSKIYQDEMLENETDNRILCKTAGYLQFLSLMMCFMWLNVLCYDVWSTIRKIQDSNRNILFLKYCLYGFGGPILLTILIVVLSNIESIPEQMKHRLGKEFCFITGGDSKFADLIYRIIPLSIMLTMNIIFYAITASTIFKIQRQSDKTLTKSNDRYSENKQRFFLYFRLFILMGISWIAEVISDLTTSMRLIINSISIINCLQGVLIFMHFIWRSRVEKCIRKKLNRKKSSKSERIETTNSLMTDTPTRKFSTIPLETFSSATETA